MKRMLLGAALLCVASACSAPAPSDNTASSNRPPANAAANAAPASTPAAALVTAAEALARENQVYDALKAKNHEAFAAMLADELVFVSGSGILDKAVALNAVKSFEPTSVTLSEVRLVNADRDLYVINYDANTTGLIDGKTAPPDYVERTSTAWVNRGGKWLAVFHQGTEIGM